MTTLLFPGQGSQFKGMGADLFDAYPDATASASDILGFPIRELCLDDPRRQLNDTRFTQPALYVTRVLALRRYLDGGGPAPVRVAGHSLGEYAALHAAGVFDFETGLRLVKRRGELMAAVMGGAMCAVIGAARPELEALIADHGLELDVANHNSPRQLVLAGGVAAIERFETLFKAVAAPGARVVRLRVSGAFHSRAMAGVAAQFLPALEAAGFAPPRIEVIANCSVEPYRLDSVADNLCRQLSATVRWVETIERCLAAGDTDFREIGPGDVLTRLVADIRASARPVVMPAPVTPAAPTTGPTPGRFEQAWSCRRPVVAGGLGGDVATPAMLAGLVDAGCLVFAGSAGIAPDALRDRLLATRALIRPGAAGRLGLNLVCDGSDPAREQALWRLAAELGIDAIELAGVPTLTRELLAYRAAGLSGGNGHSRHRVLVKLRDLWSARAFLAPPPAALLDSLRTAGVIDASAARELACRPVADSICLDSSDWRAAPADRADSSFAALRALRDAEAGATAAAPIAATAEAGATGTAAARAAPLSPPPPVTLGIAGGIATPADLAAARLHGADFVLAGSALQWTADAGLPAAVRERLAAPEAEFLLLPDTALPGYGLHTVALRPAPDEVDPAGPRWPCGPAAREAARWWRQRGSAATPSAATSAATPTAGELLGALDDAARALAAA